MGPDFDKEGGGRGGRGEGDGWGRSNCAWKLLIFLVGEEGEMWRIYIMYTLDMYVP